MIVLKPIPHPQQFAVTMRSGDAFKISLRKEGTDEIQTVDIDSTLQMPNYAVLVATFTGLQEGDFYQVTILGHNGVICLERAFVTAQNPSEYTPNNNEYIIYE